jgi:hypothetical protein
LAGPGRGALLADPGADLINVHQVLGGDDTRGHAEPSSNGVHCSHRRPCRILPAGGTGEPGAAPVQAGLPAANK